MIYKLPSQRKKQYERVESVVAIALEPTEYCEKWIPKLYQIQPDERGYHTACVRELSKVLYLNEGSVRNWGLSFKKCPDYVKHFLRLVDVVRQVQVSVDLPSNLPEK